MFVVRLNVCAVFRLWGFHNIEMNFKPNAISVTELKPFA